MTERSRFWNSTGPGDASEAPYDAPTEFAQVLGALAGNLDLSFAGGVIGGLNLSSPGANTVRVTTGKAVVYGSWYENDANVDVNVPTPSGATRNDRIVLRKSWAAQTVRITRIAGAEGGGIPALTQIVGTTWDVPLGTVVITTGGAMTVYHSRPVIAHGSVLPCEEFHLLNGESRRVFLNEATFGGRLFVHTDGGESGSFLVRGGINDVLLIDGFPANTFTVVLGTGSRINVDWNTSEYQLQNNIGSSRLFRVMLMRGF